MLFCYDKQPIATQVALFMQVRRRRQREPRLPCWA